MLGRSHQAQLLSRVVYSYTTVLPVLSMSSSKYEQILISYEISYAMFIILNAKDTSAIHTFASSVCRKLDILPFKHVSI